MVILLFNSIISSVIRWNNSKHLNSLFEGTSLVVQWLRIHLLMQGTRVGALAREDPTCHGAAKPVSHNY